MMKTYPFLTAFATLRPVRVTLLITVLAAAGSLAAWASNFTAGSLIQLSNSSPFAGCTDDDVAGQLGTNFPDSEVEPFVAVNPTNPNNIVGVWQQDRWSNAGARGFVAGVSCDGGVTWQKVVIPGLTSCAGGIFQRVSDPWLSFAPNGDLYLSSLSFDSPGLPGFSGVILVSKSTDGGLTWSNPVTVEGLNPRFLNDKESITADPTNSNCAYAVWTRLQPPPGTQFRRSGVLLGLTGIRGPAIFSRTTDGGQTWEPGRVIYDPGANAVAIANLITVLPDGTVIDFFDEFLAFKNNDGELRFEANLSLLRSPDKGNTWLPRSKPIRAAKMRSVTVTDPDTGLPVRTAGKLTSFFDVTVDPNSGNLYAVWQDARFSNFVHDSIALSMSTDGGFTWSAPIQVNKTPSTPDPLNSQAFTPSVRVAADGTVALTYYDFRFNDAYPGVLTDYFAVHCHPATADCSNPANWGNELRLSDTSFDMSQGPFTEGFFGFGFFMGDYVGLAPAGNDFVALFSQTHGTDPASAFLRRFGP